MKRFFGPAALVVLLVSTAGAPVFAAESTTPPSGLVIGPVRSEAKVDAGGQSSGTFVVANLTGKPATIQLSVRSFSVTDLTYDYQFSKPDKPWIHLAEPVLALADGQSRTIGYTISPEKQARPGGYYYSIVASTTTGGGLPSTLQAVSLLYVTIKGDLVQTGVIKDINAPKLVFSKRFDVSIDARNTGNVYYFASITGKVRGLFVRAPQSAPNHLLIPDKTRRVTSAIDSPPLPGIYPLDVSYNTDTGTTVRASQYILFIPPWSVAAILGLLLLFNVARGRRKNTTPPVSKTKS